MLALFFGTSELYPLIVAANRDEQLARSSAPPMALKETPRVIGGKDLVAGGTWLGINEHGLLVGVLNRRQSGDNERSRLLRSRGLLCLDLLESQTAVEAAERLDLEHSEYQPFNLLIADANAAYVAYNETSIHLIKLDTGLHVISNTAIYDPPSEKLDRAYALFAALLDPVTAIGGHPMRWVSSFQQALGNHELGNGATEPRHAICVHAGSYGTVSSSLVFLAKTEHRFRTFYAPGPPCREQFQESLDLEIRP